MGKALHYLLLFVLVISCKKSDLSDASVHPVKIAVLSDIHYYDPSLGTTGSAFETELSSDRKMLRESKAIFEESLKQIKQSDSGILLICGDLTKDGEKFDHEKVVAYLDDLAKTGKKIFVVPGNHDINNPHAGSFSGSVKTKISTITPGEFATIYNSFGYKNALSRDPNSLSYVAELAPGYWLIAMDGCRYAENTTSAVTGGKFSPATLQWITARLDEAALKGMKVLGMLHHGLTEHFTGQTQFFSNYVIENWQNLSKLFADKGMLMVFTGHYHAQDITMAKGTGSSAIYDCETSSLVTYPSSYRIITFSVDDKAIITSKQITSVAGIPDFLNYAKNIIMKAIDEQSWTTLAQSPFNLTSVQINQVKPTLSNAVFQNFQGDEKMDAASDLLIQALIMQGGYNAILAGNLQSMFNDLPPADNNLTIDLKNIKQQ